MIFIFSMQYIVFTRDITSRDILFSNGKSHQFYLPPYSFAFYCVLSIVFKFAGV